MSSLVRFRSFALVAALLLTSVSAQQKVVPVTEKELRAAATQKVEPDYPAVARQIRLTGDVELEVVVDESGGVEKASIISGNQLLTGPSLQAIRKWKFKPFGTDSSPARATGPIKFSFQM